VLGLGPGAKDADGSLLDGGSEGANLDLFLSPCYRAPGSPRTGGARHGCLGGLTRNEGGATDRDVSVSRRALESRNNGF
jgi:hypothetical protein